MLEPVDAHPDYQSPITIYLDSHIPLKDLQAFARKHTGNWDDSASLAARFGTEQEKVLLAYDQDLKAIHLWAVGSDGNGSMMMLHQLHEQLYEAFPQAFESKAVVQFDEFYAVLSDEGCRCEQESLANLISRMLEDYPGYLPARLNVVAEQAAEKFGGHVVRQARPDTFDPYVIY